MKTFKDILVALGVIIVISLAGVGISKIAGEYNALDFNVEFFKEANVNAINNMMVKHHENAKLVKIEGKFNYPITKLPVFDALKVESYIAVFQDGENTYYLSHDMEMSETIVLSEPQMVEIPSIEAYLGDFCSLERAARKIYRNRRKLTDNGIFSVENIDGQVVYKFGIIQVNGNGKFMINTGRKPTNSFVGVRQ